MRAIITLSGDIRFWGIDSSFTIIRVMTAAGKMRKIIRQHYIRNRQVAFAYFEQ